MSSVQEFCGEKLAVQFIRVCLCARICCDENGKRLRLPAHFRLPCLSQIYVNDIRLAAATSVQCARDVGHRCIRTFLGSVTRTRTRTPNTNAHGERQRETRIRVQLAATVDCHFVLVMVSDVRGIFMVHNFNLILSLNLNARNVFVRSPIYAISTLYINSTSTLLLRFYLIIFRFPCVMFARSVRPNQRQSRTEHTSYIVRSDSGHSGPANSSVLFFHSVWAFVSSRSSWLSGSRRSRLCFTGPPVTSSR